MYSIESHCNPIHIHNPSLNSPNRQYANITGGQSLFALSQATSLAPLALPLAWPLAWPAACLACLGCSCPSSAGAWKTWDFPMDHLGMGDDHRGKPWLIVVIYTIVTSYYYKPNESQYNPNVPLPMGNLQDPKKAWYITVLYLWPYFVGISPGK